MPLMTTKSQIGKKQDIKSSRRQEQRQLIFVLRHHIIV
jgi:hypothetical protein